LAISVDGRYKERLSGSPFMSAAAESFQHVKPDDNLARRNAIVLAVAQALAGGNNTVVVSTSSIVGAVLAPDKGLATLPVTAMVFGMWFGTLPLGFLARHYERRFALQCGSAFGILSGLISYAAVMSGNFWVLLIGTSCGGVYAAAHQSYRFAAADTASDAYRPKVVSWVFAGGRDCGSGCAAIYQCAAAWPDPPQRRAASLERSCAARASLSPSLAA
jgi:MFS family permease